jgi:hypothetical protein
MYMDYDPTEDRPNVSLSGFQALTAERVWRDAVVSKARHESRQNQYRGKARIHNTFVIT